VKIQLVPNALEVVGLLAVGVPEYHTSLSSLAIVPTNCAIIKSIKMMKPDLYLVSLLIF